MEKKHPRIKDIAKKAGVSTGTVDRVLHNRGEVSPETRKKILDIISELDYQPNFFASTLAMRRNFRFGVLIPEGSDQNPYWNDPLKGITKAALELKPYGVSLDIKTYSSSNTTNFRTLGEEFIKSRPDGLLVAPVFYEESKRFLENCQKSEMPIVFIDTQMDYPGAIRFIGQNSCQSGHVAARLLGMGNPLKSKYLVFNVIGEKDQLHHFHERLKGFNDYFTERNQQAEIIVNDIDRSSGQEKLLEILKTQIAAANPISGIFVTGSQVYRVAQALQKLEYQQIRLLGFDLVQQNINFLNQEVIDFLICQQPEEQGYIGIQTLYSVIAQNQEVNSVKYTPIEIITKENLSHYINCP